MHEKERYLGFGNKECRIKTKTVFSWTCYYDWKMVKKQKNKDLHFFYLNEDEEETH